MFFIFFVYLAWERTNVLGSANMDFEINQVRTLSTNGVTPIRTPGDLLVTFDFGGSGSPVIGLLTWLDSTNGTVGQCFSNNSLPCWGNHESISATGEAEGSVNTGIVLDNNAPLININGTPGQLPASTFGEAAVDLTDSGIFQSNVCSHFGAAYLKSRSAASFTAEVKDFIAPVNIDISNCGNIVVQKVTVPSGSSQSFDFTLSGAATTTLPKTFSLQDKGSNSTQVFAGSGYSVAETPVTGWDLTSAVCDQGQTPGSITVAVDQTVTCVFTNTQRGNLIIKKVTDPSSDTTTSFAFTDGGGLTPSSFSLVGGGSQSFSNILPGSGYSVAETPTTGWDLISSSCDNGSPLTAIVVSAGGTTTCTFTNEARVSITILKLDDKKNPLQGAVFTAYDSSNTAVGTCTTGANGQCTISDLIPGTYKISETTPVPGYDAAADQSVTLTAGQTITLTFTDPTQYTIIVLVCRVHDSSLYASSVTVDGVQKTSLSPNGGGSLSDSALCGLGGASYTDKLSGSHPANVTIP